MSISLALVRLSYRSSPHSNEQRHDTKNHSQPVAGRPGRGGRNLLHIPLRRLADLQCDALSRGRLRDPRTGSRLGINGRLRDRRLPDGGAQQWPALHHHARRLAFCDVRPPRQIDELWQRLAENGMVMMPLDAYDWSERYGWVQDRFGMTWQLSLGNIDDVGQKIAPSFLFVGDQFGHAEEAVELYTSVSPGSEVVGVLRYGAGEPGREGTVKHAQFSLAGDVFMAMDGPGEHEFGFSPGVSLIVRCRSQQEIDHFWEKLSEGGDPEAQQCGWLADRFGVSWQIVPERLYEMLQDPDAERVGRVTASFLGMKKMDIAELERVYAGAAREVA